MSKAPANVDREELTIAARRVLLDGLDALSDHLDAITVVGAQAVHLRTADAVIKTAAFTSDGDLGLDPALIANEPLLEEALAKAGFKLRSNNQPGLWGRPETINGIETDVELDLLVGSTLAAGGRGARIQPHNKMAARKVPGLETAVVDRSPMVIGSLEAGDDRSIQVHVAGPVSLLVAKAHKLRDRLAEKDSRPDRLIDKDAADVYRIMITTRPDEIAASFANLVVDQRVGTVTASGLRYLQEQFGGADTPGVRLAIAALAGDVPESRIRAYAPAFIKALPSIS